MGDLVRKISNLTLYVKITYNQIIGLIDKMSFNSLSCLHILFFSLFLTILSSCQCSENKLSPPITFISATNIIIEGDFPSVDGSFTTTNGYTNAKIQRVVATDFL